jgi:hypothetical protein
MMSLAIAIHRGTVMSGEIMISRKVLVATLIAFALSGSALAQDLSKLVTKFKDGWKPMEGQIMFQQEGGDLQISVEVEKRDTGASVRSWEATMKKMQPATKVETVKGIGGDAIYYSTRADLGKLSADFEKPRVQMSVAVAGAKTTAQAKQIVTDLAKVVGPRVGK